MHAKAEERQFWELLTRRRRAASLFRLRNVDLTELGDEPVQPLEILVADTLTEICPDVRWSVTPVQGDGGIDLLGSADCIALRLRGTEIRFEYSIVGQVKRSRAYKASTLHGIFGSIRTLVDQRGLTLSRLLLVMSAEGRAVERFQADAPILAHQQFPGIPLSFVNADDLAWLWSRFGPHRFEVIRPAYTDAEFHELTRHLEARALASRGPAVEIIVEQPVGHRVVASDLDVSVSIQVSSAYPRQRLEVRLRPGSNLDVVRPLSLLSEGSNAATLGVGEDGSARLLLRFRARQAGTHDLGQIEVRHASGEARWIGRSLGTVAIDPDHSGRHIRFVPTVNSAAQRALDRLAGAAAACGVESVVLLGQGGIGKSRIVEALFDRLDPQFAGEKRPIWSSVRVDRDTQRSSGAGFLMEVVRALALDEPAEAGARLPNGRAAIAERLKRFVGSTAAAVDEGLLALAGNATPDLVEVAAFVLVTATIARLREGPLALHLSNLHWVNSFESDVLGLWLQRIVAVEPHLTHGLLAVLEGRQGELLHRDPAMTPEPWQRLQGSGQVRHRLVLHPWEESQSRRFLREVLTSMTGAPLDDAALERRIAALVLRSSGGNPMHMLEHIRWLIDEGHLRAEADGSVLLDPPERSPHSLIDLIASRVEFIKRSQQRDELSALLRLCAEIGLRTDADLFEAMVNAMSAPQALSLLSRWGVARVPSGRGEAFEFLHETYREAFARIGWPTVAGAPLRRAVISRFSPAAAQPPERALAAARLVMLDPACDLGAVAADLEDAAERNRSDPQASVAICSELLRLPVHVQGPRRRFELTCRLADALVDYGDWKEALRAIQRGRSELPDKAAFLLAKADLAHRAGNILGDIHLISDGMRAVEEGLFALDSVRGSGPAEEAPLRELLENRLGVLLWFSGRLNEGLVHQLRAFRSARRFARGSEREMLMANELGMSLATRHPLLANRLLDRATTLLAALGEDAPAGDDYVWVQREMLRLLLAETEDELESISEVVLEFTRKVGRSVYGRGLAWLVAGACDMLMSRPAEAKRKFEEAITSAALCRNLRIRWKAHLAFAAAATAAAGTPREAAHARYAGEILAESLEGVDPRHRSVWAATIRLPLEHVRRLGGQNQKLDALLAELDTGGSPFWVKDWCQRPGVRPAPGAPPQILHVRAGEADIFLMG